MSELVNDIGAINGGESGRELQGMNIQMADMEELGTKGQKPQKQNEGAPTQTQNLASKFPIRPKFLENASHPGVCMFHFGFKAAAFIVYIFFGLLSDEDIFCYIIVLTLCAFDFWTVKNVSGR